MYAKPRANKSRTAEVTEDGQIWVDAKAYLKPGGAARAVSGKQEQGWQFWATEPHLQTTLEDLRSEYMAGIDANIDEQLLDED